MTKTLKNRRNYLSSSILDAIKERCRVICTGNGKGGVGKSTYAFHLAAVAVEAGLKTLLIDNDEHLTITAFGTTDPDFPDNAFSCDLFTEAGIVKPIMQLEELPGCWFLPRDSRLDDVNSTSFESGIVLLPHQHIQKLREEFDLIIIDSPPGRGNLQQATFLCADVAAMVTELSNTSLNGVVTAITVTETLVENLSEGVEDSNFKTPYFIVIPNKFNSKSTDERNHYKRLLSYDILLTGVVVNRTPIVYATDHLIPVWKINNGNARLAGKEIKLAIEEIFKLAVKK
ncbi:ParA family protein [Pectobacterium carotovorum subsp. carotovorum]|nr:ParA family protein [Pectobacterium carotovorum]MCL6336324.1 ParA family protein [Pectobacterium carotovorum subsp. carotovorum]